MRVLQSPKFFLVLGGLLLAVLIILAGREVVLRRIARTVPPYAVHLEPAKRRELQEKIAAANAAITKNVNDFGAYVDLALARADLGDREGAAEVYRTMNQRFPGNYLSYQNLGRLYEDTGRYLMAAEQYLIAIQNAPRNPHVYRNVVELYTYHLQERAGDIPRILQQGLAVSPESVDLMSMLAVYYRDHGDRAEAIRWYEHLLVFDKDNRTALEELQQLKAQIRK